MHPDTWMTLTPDVVQDIHKDWGVICLESLQQCAVRVPCVVPPQGRRHHPCQ